MSYKFELKPYQQELMEIIKSFDGQIVILRHGLFTTDSLKKYHERFEEIAKLEYGFNDVFVIDSIQGHDLVSLYIGECHYKEPKSPCVEDEPKPKRQPEYMRHNRTRKRNRDR